MAPGSFAAYIVILFVATIIPGPSMLLAMNHGVNHGLSRALCSGFGNVAGNLLMAILSILGLGAVLIASGMVFNVIKWIGIAYLIGIGLDMVLHSAKGGAQPIISNQNGKKSFRKLFMEGFIIAIGNPKGILFFTSLFPQFIADRHSPASVSLILLPLVLIAFFCYFVYAIFGTRLSGLFIALSFRKIFNRICGSFFIFTGLAMAHSRK